MKQGLQENKPDVFKEMTQQLLNASSPFVVQIKHLYLIVQGNNMFLTWKTSKGAGQDCSTVMMNRFGV